MIPPIEQLRQIEIELAEMIERSSEVISQATSTRPGMAAGLSLLYMQRSLATALSAVNNARNELTPAKPNPFRQG